MYLPPNILNPVSYDGEGHRNGKRGENVEKGEQRVIGRAMRRRRKAVANYYRLRGGKGIGKWWENKIGQTDVATYSRCGEKDDTPDDIVFWCMKIKRMKDMEREGRREWVRENNMGWDSWYALASKKWVRMEDTSRVDDEGKAVLDSEKVDLKEEFFRNVHHQVSSIFVDEFLPFSV